MEEQQKIWAEIYELQRWNAKAREMIMENQTRITELKKQNININNKENDNGSQG